MGRRNARHYANIGPRNFRQAGQFAAARHPHFEHGRFVRFVQSKQRQRQAILIIEITFRLQNAEARAQQCRQDLFGRGLADGTRNAGDFAAPRFADSAGQLLEGDEGVRDGDAAGANGLVVGGKARLGDHSRQRTTAQRGSHMIVSIVTRSVDGEEQLSGT